MPSGVKSHHWARYTIYQSNNSHYYKSSDSGRSVYGFLTAEIAQLMQLGSLPRHSKVVQCPIYWSAFRRFCGPERSFKRGLRSLNNRHKRAALSVVASSSFRTRPASGRALIVVNDITKWAVSIAAFATLLLRRDLLSCWCIFGAVTSSFANRALKTIINESRPPEAQKPDPGMPSAHANSLAFLSTFCALAAAKALPVGEVVWVLLVFGVPSLAIFLAWLRVVLGFHTIPQVIVGWLVGSGVAASWWIWGHRSVLPFIETNDPTLAAQMYMLTFLAVTAFSMLNVRRWLKEKKESARN